MTQSADIETVYIHPNQPVKNSIIWLHGLGADGYDFVDIVPQLGLPTQLASRFIFPHAPVMPVSLNSGLPMRAWYDIYGLDIDSRQDAAGVEAAYQRLIPLIEAEIQAGVAPEKIVLAGFSQGGALALYSALKFPKPLAGVLALSTYLPIADHLQQYTPMPNRHIKIFMAHGLADNVLDLSIAEYSHTLLTDIGCQVDWHTYTMAHSVCAKEISDISRWLQTVLA
ncbi:MAG: alpha/beta fold hydrolase [Gammaproteobacteria bacterium]